MSRYPELFVGRSAELAELDRHWVAASKGQSRTVLISGPAGIGKTALVTSFVQATSPVGRWSIAGDEYEHLLAYAAVNQLLAVLSPTARPAPLAWDSPHTAGSAVLRQIADSGPGPAMLLVDDLHLVDPESVLAMLFALRRLRSQPLLAVFTFRPEGSPSIPAGLGRLAHADSTEIVLEGLSTTDVTALGAAEGRQLTARAATRLHKHTEGNPLHLRALLRELSDAQLRSRSALPAPRSFAMLVLGTLSSLSPAAQALAQAAAILPDHTPVRQLAGVAEVADANAGLEELHETRLLMTRGVGIDATVAFHHPLIRGAIEDDIGPARRTSLHRRAAAVTAGEQALHHQVAAATHPDTELVNRLREAAAGHQAGAHWRSAARDLRSAAGLTDDPGERDELTLAAADALLMAADARAAAELMSDLSRMPRSGRRLVVQARLLSLQGDHDAAMVCAEQALTHAVELDLATRDAIAAMLTERYLTMDQAGAGLAWVDRVLASGWLPAQQAPATRGARATALAMLGRIPEGLAGIDDLPADPFELPPSQRDRARHRGTLRLWSDDLDGAITDLEAACDAPEFRFSPYAIVSVALLVEAYFRMGRWDECGELIDRAASLIEDTDQIWFASFIHAHAALVPGARGDWQTAEQCLQRAADTAAQIPTPARSHYLANAVVHVAACRGDWPAVITLGDAMRRQHGATTQPGIFKWPVRYAEAMLRTGHRPAADEWLTLLERQARQQHRRSRLAGIARIRAELAAERRDHQPARAAFREAVELADGVDALEHMMALLGYGRYLRRRGERRAAMAQLTRARERAQALGAAPLVAACDAELTAACRTLASGADEPFHELTPQERAVARLVCAGKSNRQIADQLFLSTKTIDYHLRNAYRKLDVHSRGQLVAMAASAAAAH